MSQANLIMIPRKKINSIWAMDHFTLQPILFPKSLGAGWMFISPVIPGSVVLDGLKHQGIPGPPRTLLQEVFQHAMTGCFLWQGDVDPVAPQLASKQSPNVSPPKEIEKVRAAIVETYFIVFILCQDWILGES